MSPHARELHATPGSSEASNRISSSPRAVDSLPRDNSNAQYISKMLLNKRKIPAENIVPPTTENKGNVSFRNMKNFRKFIVAHNGLSLVKSITKPKEHMHADNREISKREHKMKNDVHTVGSNNIGCGNEQSLSSKYQDLGSLSFSAWEFSGKLSVASEKRFQKDGERIGRKNGNKEEIVLLDNKVEETTLASTQNQKVDDTRKKNEVRMPQDKLDGKSKILEEDETILWRGISSNLFRGLSGHNLNPIEYHHHKAFAEAKEPVVNEKVDFRLLRDSEEIEKPNSDKPIKAKDNHDCIHSMDEQEMVMNKGAIAKKGDDFEGSGNCDDVGGGDDDDDDDDDGDDDAKVSDALLKELQNQPNSDKNVKLDLIEDLRELVLMHEGGIRITNRILVDLWTSLYFPLFRSRTYFLRVGCLVRPFPAQPNNV